VISDNLKPPPTNTKLNEACDSVWSSLCVMETLVTTLNHTLSKLRLLRTLRD
jgi:hypothetical protein